MFAGVIGAIFDSNKGFYDVIWFSNFIALRVGILARFGLRSPFVKALQ